MMTVFSFFSMFSIDSIITLYIVVCLSVTMVVPLSVHIGMLVVFMFFFGVATGSLDNGRSALTQRLYNHIDSAVT